MRESISITLVAAALTLTLGLPEVVAGESPSIADPAADLLATEEAFARTMADRDHQAFVSFLAEETVFFGRRGEIRGSDAVAAAWKSFYEGPEAPFSWQPETATVLDSGTLGLTSGPVFAPDENRIGTFKGATFRIVAL
jgi:ketosteroid isomerase-like protein